MPDRPYQIKLVDETTPALWKQGCRSIVWVAPTGAGKTRMAHRMIKKVRDVDWAQVWYLAGSEELIDQPAADFGVDGIPHAFVKAGRDPDPGCPTQVCQVQTLVNREVVAARDARGQPYRRALVFVDEAHHVKSATYLAIRDRLRALYGLCYFLLMTATPYRRDGRGLADVADALVEATTPRLLIEAGWLANPVYWCGPPEPEGETPTARRSRLVGDVVETWLRQSGGAPTIGRAINVAHSKALVERFRARGVRAEHVDGSTPGPLRAELFARLAIGGRASDHPLAVDVLSTGGTILEEGFDSLKSYRHVLGEALRGRLWLGRSYPPRYRPLGCLGDWAPTSARGAWIQRVGRVARVHGPEQVAELARTCGAESDVKARPVVLSHGGNLEKHGFLVQHEGFNLEGDVAGATTPGRGAPRLRVRGPLTCPTCYAVEPVGTPACGACGTELGAGQMDLPEEDTSVELVRREWTPDAPPPATAQAMEALLRKLYATQRARDSERQAQGLPPYKDGWSRGRFFAVYRRWPDYSLENAIRFQFGYSPVGRR